MSADSEYSTEKELRPAAVALLSAPLHAYMFLWFVPKVALPLLFGSGTAHNRLETIDLVSRGAYPFEVLWGWVSAAFFRVLSANLPDGGALPIALLGGICGTALFYGLVLWYRDFLDWAYREVPADGR